MFILRSFLTKSKIMVEKLNERRTKPNQTKKKKKKIHVNQKQKKKNKKKKSLSIIF